MSVHHKDATVLSAELYSERIDVKREAFKRSFINLDRWEGRIAALSLLSAFIGLITMSFGISIYV